MPNQNNSISKKTPQYDASDMQDLASMSECDMAWMCTAIEHIRKEVIRLNKLAVKGEKVTQYHFTDLIHHIEMYGYLATDRHNYHAIEAERYKIELEQLKGGAQ